MKVLLTVALLLGVWGARPASAQTSTPPAGRRLLTATFAGGCFWCMEEAFEKVGGVLSVTSGYTGGAVRDPDYEQVSSGGTGHAESGLLQEEPGPLQVLQVQLRAGPAAGSTVGEKAVRGER